MNKIVKNILITFAILAVIVFAFRAIAFGISASLSSASKTIGDSYGTNCEEKQTWTIRGYKIMENECIGFVGPHYRKFDLFENEKIIEDYVSMTDSCTVNFQKSDDLVIKFDICSETITELKAQTIQ